MPTFFAPGERAENRRQGPALRKEGMIRIEWRSCARPDPVAACRRVAQLRRRAVRGAPGRRADRARRIAGIRRHARSRLAAAARPRREPDVGIQPDPAVRADRRGPAPLHPRRHARFETLPWSPRRARPSAKAWACRSSAPMPPTSCARSAMRRSRPTCALSSRRSRPVARYCCASCGARRSRCRCCRDPPAVAARRPRRNSCCSPAPTCWCAAR